MKKYEDIKEIKIELISSSAVFTKEPDWVSIDGISFIKSKDSDILISFDLEDTTYDAFIIDGRIHLSAIKTYTDVDHYYGSAFTKEEYSMLKSVDFSILNEYILIDQYTIADYDGKNENLKSHDFLVTELKLIFNDGSTVSATPEQLVRLHLEKQKDLADQFIL